MICKISQFLRSTFTIALGFTIYHLIKPFIISVKYSNTCTGSTEYSNRKSRNNVAKVTIYIVVLQHFIMLSRDTLIQPGLSRSFSLAFISRFAHCYSIEIFLILEISILENVN